LKNYRTKRSEVNNCGQRTTRGLIILLKPLRFKKMSADFLFSRALARFFALP